MKKKIINGIMMVALVAATSTSFVSCKDTNEDVRVEQAIEIAGLQGRLTTLENQYGDLDGRVSAMKNRLDDVQALAEQNRDDIDVLQLNVDAIEEEIGQLELWLIETFAKLVTSVEISGTYNNMTGSINIPGFEPKMLIFNYGVAAKDGKFPTTAEVEEPLIWFANEEIGAGEFNEGNAGYIYANVNRYLDTPLLTKAQDEDSFFDFKLVNTAGEEAEGVKIKNADEDGAPTEDVLQWGWTRADNNIFKFSVAYDGDEAKNFEPAKIDLKTLKEDLKAVWRDRNKATGTSKEALGRLVADLYYKYATADTNLKKYALKIAWMDNTLWKYEKDAEDAEDDYADIVPSDESTGLKHMVTSEAELVFAAIKPLGFNSGEVFAEAVGNGIQDVNAVVEKGEVLLNKIFDKIKAQIPNFNPITFDLTSGILYDAGARVYYISLDNEATPGYQAPSANLGTGAISGDIDITDLIVNMNLNVNNGIASVNDMMAQLNTLKNKLNGSSVTNWIEKFTNKANTLFANHAGQILQPTLLAINNGVVNRVSGVKELPYIAAGEVTLKPTTYTAELFAPCYAKFVGCKDIEEDNFNQILKSGDQELKFTPEAGKLYEIVYEAVDFFGNTFEHKYYILGGVK